MQFADYLRQIMKVCGNNGKTKEWQAYLAEVRLQNSRRPRMLDVLNSLEDRWTRIME